MPWFGPLWVKSQAEVAEFWFLRGREEQHWSSSMKRSAFSFGLGAVAMMLGLAGSAQAADLEGELGILDPLNANGGINPATAVAWEAGDTYRLVFVTSTRTTAESRDIAYYNAFVQDAADDADLGGTWKAIASVQVSAPVGADPGGYVNARDNTSTNENVDPLDVPIVL
ncbi:MAG: hypothetical protein JRI25_14335, partial [Deltaproteobacteria bacterium]|nr:hypothetical protein [Deltaproteobacteria bacterium]